MSGPARNGIGNGNGGAGRGAPSAARGAALARRVDELLDEARGLFGAALSAPASVEQRGTAAAAEVAAAIGMMATEELYTLRRGDARVAPVCALALHAADLEAELRQYTIRRRKHALAAVEGGLNRLRCIDTSAKLVDHICREVAECTELTRVSLGHVIDGVWSQWKVYPDLGEVGDEDRAWLADARIPLDEMPLESELLQRRDAGMVRDAVRDPRTYKPLVAALHTRSYVAAPIMRGSDVVGFLHADYHPSERQVDRVDRDILWVFADDFGRIYERTVLLERLHAQRMQVRETLRNAEAIMDHVATAELEIARKADERSIVASAASLALAHEKSEIDELLTPREREILVLVVAGHNNGMIADQLVIAEGTVKSHVKHILRKLGAMNRSELIARYLETVSPSVAEGRTAGR